MSKFLALTTLTIAFGLSLTSAATAVITAPIPIYCKDSTGTIQYMKYFNYVSMVKRFGERYAFDPTIGGDDETLTFSDPKATKFYLRYKIKDYTGERGPGYALLSLHVNMGGMNRTLVGNDLCLFTMNNVLGGD